MKTGRTFPVLMWMLAMALWGCPPSKKEPPTPNPMPTPTPSAKGTLSFDDDGVSWIATGNYFAQRSRPSVPKWFGVLFQFGPFTANPFQGEVQFLSPTGTALTTAPLTTEGTLAESQFTWINIVSNRPGAEAPVMPNESLQLFPNTSSTNPCDMVSGNNCLRDRRIHWDQPRVSFIVTFWQGDNGYEVEVKPAAAHPDRNEVEFKFQDDFTVDVYQLTATGMNPVLHLDAGAVGSIKVKNTQEGTPHGGKHDPTWDIITPP